MLVASLIFFGSQFIQPKSQWVAQEQWSKRSQLNSLISRTSVMQLKVARRFVLPTIQLPEVNKRFSCNIGDDFVSKLQNIYCTRVSMGECLCLNLGTGLDNVGQLLGSMITNPSGFLLNFTSGFTLKVKFTF